MNASQTARNPAKPLVWNPYLDAYYAAGGKKSVFEDGWLESSLARHALIRQYSFAIPNAEVIDAIAGFVPLGRRLVEVGAGSGYWAAVLQVAYPHLPILAVDDGSWASPLEETPVKFERPSYASWSESPFFPVKRGSGILAASEAGHTGAVLMMVWPPYDDDFANLALGSFSAMGGKRFVFVGESHGGCTGNEAFFARIEMEEWEQVACVRIPRWSGVNDAALFYERRIL